MTVLSKIIRKTRNRLTEPLERRLHRRAMLYWHSLIKGCELPSISEFDALKLEDRSAHGFVISLNNGRQPQMSSVGDILREEASILKLPVTLAEVPPNSLLGQFGRRWEQVLSERKPVISEYDFMTEAGYHVFCRGVLLPFSSDGSTIDHIYGVISWKSEKIYVGNSQTLLLTKQS